MNGQRIGFAEIDQVATLNMIPIDEGRTIAELAAKEWAEKKANPPSAMATLKRAMAEHRNTQAVHQQRVVNEKKRGPDRSGTAWVKP